MDPKDKNLRQDLQDLTDKIEITQKLHGEPLKDENELAHFRPSRLSMARLMLIGHPSGLCGILLSDLLIIIFRLPRHSFSGGGWRRRVLLNFRDFVIQICGICVQKIL